MDSDVKGCDIYENAWPISTSINSLITKICSGYINGFIIMCCVAYDK